MISMNARLIVLASLTVGMISCEYARAEQPDEISVEKTGSQTCQLQVSLGGVKRGLNIGDLKYLRNQPGTIPLLKEVDPQIDSAEKVDKLTKANPREDTTVPLLGENSKQCAGLEKIAEKLKKRLSDNKWPHESASDFIKKSLTRGGFDKFKLPSDWNASAPPTPAGIAPASAPARK